jgi:hypothetical protein
VNEFVTVALEGAVANVLSTPLIVLIALRRSFRFAIGSALTDAHELRSIHLEANVRVRRLLPPQWLMGWLLSLRW